MISRKRSAVVRALKTEGLTIDEIREKVRKKDGSKMARSSIRRYLRDSKELKNPKVLLLDIETSPVWTRVWGLYKQRIPFQNVLRDWFMLCWSAKCLGSDELIADSVTRVEALRRDDSRISHSIWKILNEVDVVIGHNLSRFDLRKIMARFIEHGLPKPSPYRTIDTLIQSRKSFAFSAHNLDYLNSIFSLRMKKETDYQLWKDCEGWKVKTQFFGDDIYPFEPIPKEIQEEALEYMLHYCKSDVKALEDLYIRLRPYITSFPNLGLYIDDEEPMCPYCMSRDLMEEGFYTTQVSKFQSYRCLRCGALSRGRKSLLTKEKRDSLIVSAAR